MSEGLRVLLVDDDAGLLGRLAAVLRRQGHHVYAASDAEGAREIARRTRPQVALIDHRLPGERGLDLAGALTLHGDVGAAVLMSGQLGPALAEDAERRGVVECLAKPFSSDEMIDVVARMAVRASPPERRWR